MIPTREERINATGRIEYFYKVDHPKKKKPTFPIARYTYVDQEGYSAWCGAYEKLRADGLNHETSIQAVEHALRVATGLVVDPPPPPPPTVQPRTGIVRLVNRGFVDDGGPFLGTIFTDMSALRLFESDRARHDRNCVEMVKRGATAARILGMVGWPGRMIDPRRADYLDLLRGCIQARYALGLRTELTMFADCHVLGLSMASRRTHAQKVANGLKGLEHMLLFIEGSNEPGVSNYNGPWTIAQLIEIGQIVKAELPNVLYACGAPFTEPDGGTTWDDGAYNLMGHGADLVTPHFDRDTSKHDAQYRPIRQCIEGQNYGFPYSNNEPIGPGASVASERNAGRLRAAATFTWIARGAGYCYHTDAGIGARSDEDIAHQPGADAVFDGARILAGDAPTFSFSNWHRAENVWETLDGSLSDHDLNGRGTMRTICGVRGNRVQAQCLLVAAGATLRARQAMTLNVWRGLDTGPYQHVDTITVARGQTYEVKPCVDTVFEGVLL